MRYVFQAPVAIAETTRDAGVEAPVFAGHVFAPLSAPRLWENRIDLAVKAKVEPRRYAYKRADESVN